MQTAYSIILKKWKKFGKNGHNCMQLPVCYNRNNP